MSFEFRSASTSPTNNNPIPEGIEEQSRREFLGLGLGTLALFTLPGIARSARLETISAELLLDSPNLVDVASQTVLTHEWKSNTLLAQRAALMMAQVGHMLKESQGNVGADVLSQVMVKEFTNDQFQEAFPTIKAKIEEGMKVIKDRAAAAGDNDWWRAAAIYLQRVEREANAAGGRFTLTDSTRAGLYITAVAAPEGAGREFRKFVGNASSPLFVSAVGLGSRTSSALLKDRFGDALKQGAAVDEALAERLQGIGTLPNINKLRETLSENPYARELVRLSDVGGTPVLEAKDLDLAAGQQAIGVVTQRIQATAADLGNQVSTIQNLAKTAGQGVDAIKNAQALLSGKISNANLSFDIAGDIIGVGLGQPKIAEAINTVSKVISQVKEVQGILSAGSNLLGSVGPLVALGPVGGIIAGLAAISSLFNNNAEVLEGINNIRQDIATLRKEVAELRNEMRERFEKVEKLQLETLRRLDEIKVQLDQLARKVDNSTASLSREIQEVLQTILSVASSQKYQDRVRALFEKFFSIEPNARQLIDSARRGMPFPAHLPSPLEVMRQFYSFAMFTSREPNNTGNNSQIPIVSVDELTGLAPKILNRFQVPMPNLRVSLEMEGLPVGSPIVNPVIWSVGTRAFLEMKCMKYRLPAVSRAEHERWLKELWNSGLDVQDVVEAATSPEIFAKALANYKKVTEALFSPGGILERAVPFQNDQGWGVSPLIDPAVMKVFQSFADGNLIIAGSIFGPRPPSQEEVNSAHKAWLQNGKDTQNIFALSVWRMTNNAALASEYVIDSDSGASSALPRSIGNAKALKDFLTGLSEGVSKEWMVVFKKYVASKQNAIAEELNKLPPPTNPQAQGYKASLELKLARSKQGDKNLDIAILALAERSGKPVEQLEFFSWQDLHISNIFFKAQDFIPYMVSEWNRQQCSQLELCVKDLQRMPKLRVVEDTLMDLAAYMTTQGISFEAV